MAGFLVLCCFAEADTLLEKRVSKKAVAQPPPYTDGHDSCNISITTPIDHEKAALQKNLYSAPPNYREAPIDKEIAGDSTDSCTKPAPANRSANRRSVARPKTSSWASRIFRKKETQVEAEAIVAHTTGDEAQLRWEHENALKTETDPKRRKELEEKEARRRAQWSQQRGHKR